MFQGRNDHRLGAGDEFARFCALVLTDTALQQQLQAPDDPGGFVALVVEIARQRGFGLLPDAIAAAMRAPLPGIGHWGRVDIAETPLPPAGWLPIDAFWRGEQPWVEWCHFGALRLVDPFFTSSVQRRLQKPFNRLFRCATPIARLPEWRQQHAHLPPSGFIFHMSRCGSTLVSQMLAALASNIVVSEAPPIDAIAQMARMTPEPGDQQSALWLAALIDSLGHRRSEAERHFFVKLDCWHTAALPLFRRAFPSVPWVFLYREPVEVIVSQMRMPGAQMLPPGIGLAPYGVEWPYGAADAAEDHYARILAKVCEPVLQHVDDGGLLINYRQLPEAVWTAILPHFGVACSDADRAAMARAARWDAKIPGVEFAADSAEKQSAASAAARTAAERWIGDLYRRLETKREAGAG
jgi:hypothetical protein